MILKPDRSLTSLGLLLSLQLSAPAQATDLGALGNAEAAKLFQNYQAAPAVCDATAPGKRVLLTGFGLFQNIPLNSAGAVVSNIVNPSVWPAEFKANQRVALPAGTVLDNGRHETNQGAAGFTRSITISGEKINLCVLVLDVLWDVAGSIVSYEMDRFQPQAVLMLGGGGGPILEGGALNQTMSLEGYYADGSPAKNNLPTVGFNLPDAAAGSEIPMLWDNQALHKSVTPLLKKAKLELTTAPGARPSNIYLCNQTSYIALATAANRPISLAGGLIALEPKIESHPQVGFFHLPWDLQLDAATIERWGSLVASVAYFMVK